MAASLKIHVRTVDFHLGNLRSKVKVNGLVALAVACERLNGAIRT